MSERTTGRKMLADLDARVCSLEGTGKPEPWEDMRKELGDIHRRLNEIDARLAETPAKSPPKVAKAKEGAA